MHPLSLPTHAEPVTQLSSLHVTVSSFFIDGVPYDGVPVDATATIHIAMTVVYFILMTAGIAFAVFCLFFNLCFRDKK